MSTTAAAWLAAGAGLAATLLVGWSVLRAWRAWERLAITREAAAALLDAHGGRLDETLRTAGDRVGEMADGGERLADAIAELRTDVDHLRWLVERVPAERARLRREIGEILLPGRAERATAPSR